MPVWVCTNPRNAVLEPYGTNVPSLDDFNNLQNQITSIKNSLSSLVTETEFKEIIDAVTTSFTELTEFIDEQNENLFNTLNDGDWKRAFSQEMQNTLRKIEERCSQINGELDKKMAQAARCGQIEDKVKKILLEHEEKVKMVIRSAGQQLKAELDEKIKNSEIVEILKQESQTVTWEN